jgi:hypothetical protein
MKHWICALAISFLALSANAAEPDRSYCELAGYFKGEGDQFMLGLTLRAVLKQGILSESQCRLIWDGAAQIGKRAASGKIESGDDDTIRKVSIFRNKVYDFILKSISP